MSGQETQRRLDIATRFYNESLADHEDKAIKSACKGLKDGKVCTNKVNTIRG